MQHPIMACGLAMSLCLVALASGQVVGVPDEATVSTCNAYEENTRCKIDLLCSCHANCSSYNDCCNDTRTDPTNQNGARSQGLAGDGSHSDAVTGHVVMSRYEVCVEFSSSLVSTKFQFVRDRRREYTLPNGYWLVGRCPPSWSNATTRRLCEAPAGAFDHLLLLPVTSSTDNLTTFRNFYCAVCHGVPVGTLTAWNVVSDLRTKNATDLSVATLSSFPGFDGMKRVRFVPERSGLRKCLRNVVDSCPAGYQDDRVVESCRSYMVGVVQPQTHVIYRNWFCALCNGALDPQLQICAPLSPFPMDILSTSLTALIDFQGTRLVLENASWEIGRDCGHSKFIDPFSLQCRALCPEGFRLTASGVCVASTTRPRAPPTGIVDRNCASANHVELEVDMCLTEASSDPCERWKELLGEEPPASPLIWTSGHCIRKQGIDADYKMKDGKTCAHVAGIRVILNSKVHLVNDALKEVLGRHLSQRCPCNVSIHQVVVKRGCLPPSETETCHDYHAESNDSVFLASWNKSSTLYVRDTNALFLLSETLYQIVYKPRSGGSLNATHIVTHCGDRISHFNCSFELISSVDQPHSDHVVLESGDALVCRHLVSTGSDEQQGVSGLTVVTYISIFISMVALVASFVTYVVFPSIRNLPGQCVMSLIVAVFSSQLLILVTGDDVARSVGGPSCAALAVLLHYTCLASFSWTNALAFYLARTLGPGAKPSAAHQHRNSFLFFSLFGWGLPLAIIFVCLMVSLNTGLTYGVSVADTGISSCSFTDKYVEIFAFVVPVSVSLLVNAGLFVAILAGFTFRRRPSANLYSREARTSHVRRDALISTKVGFLLAFSWIFGFLSFAFSSQVLLYFFCILTSLQGVYIFLAFTFTQQVRTLWRERLGMKRPEPTTNKATPRRPFQRPKKVVSSTADKKDLCRENSPSEHTIAHSARTGMAEHAEIV